MDSRRRGPRHSTGNLFDPFHPSRCDRVDRFPGRLFTNLVRFYTTIILSFSFNFFFFFISSREYFVVDFVTLLRPPLVVGRNYPPVCSTIIHVSLLPFSFFFPFCSLYTRILSTYIHTQMRVHIEAHLSIFCEKLPCLGLVLPFTFTSSNYFFAFMYVYCKVVHVYIDTY